MDQSAVEEKEEKEEKEKEKEKEKEEEELWKNQKPAEWDFHRLTSTMLAMRK